MDIFLRQCRMEDIDKLRALSMQTFYETFAALNTPENMDAYLNRAFDREKLRKELADRDSRFFFLYFNEKLAGYLKINEAPAQTDQNDPASLEIERIYVSGGFQGKGLGRYLMEQAIQIAVARKKKYIWLGVWEKNERAIRFYKRNGFYKTGTHSFVVGEDVQTDHLMQKDLSYT